MFSLLSSLRSCARREGRGRARCLLAHPHPDSTHTHPLLPPSLPPSLRSQILSITPADVRAWLGEWERPDASVLAVVGDFDPGAVRPLLERALGGGAGWRAPPAPPLPLPNPPLPAQGGVAGRVFLVDRPGATQVDGI